MGFEVRIDAVQHLVPKKEGKKEWYIIHCSKQYAERDGFVGWEHMDKVFLTPAQYKNIESILEIGSIVKTVVEIGSFNGRMTINVVGFEE